MSTQEASTALPVVYAREQSGLRLMELPPDLNAAIIAGQISTLYIKSAQSSPSHKQTSGPGLQNVVLCTDLKTYQLRQVQTSNTVLVARPHCIQSDQFKNVESSHDLMSQSETACLSTFASCSAFLELSALDTDTIATTKTRTAELWLHHLMQTFSECSPEDGRAKDSRNPALPPKSKREIFSDVPYSENECEDAWQALCAFEVNGVALKPSAELLLRAWKEIFQCFDLTKTLDLTAMKQLLLETPDFPDQLLESILKRISINPDEGNILMLEPSKAIIFIGEVHYAMQLFHIEPSARETSHFALDTWRSLVPEGWRNLISMDLLMSLDVTRFKPAWTTGLAKRGSSSVHEDKSFLLELVRRSESTSLQDSRSSDNPVADLKKTGRNRNWHEKFRSSKNTQSVA